MQERQPVKTKPPRPVAGPADIPERVPRGNNGSGMKLAAKILGLLGVGIGCYWFFFTASSGLPVPENAYHDKEHSFALIQPQGWKITTVKDCRPSGASFGTAKDICNVLTVEEERRANQTRPNFQVTVAPVSSLFKTGWGGSVRITEGNKDEIAQTIEKGIAGSIPGYKNESAEIVVVDNLSAIEVVGSARIEGYPVMIGKSVVTVPFGMGGSPPVYHMTIGGVLVVGGTTAYFITFGCESSDYSIAGRIFHDIIDSFRVTERHPTPFQRYGGLWGSIKGDAILGALIGLAIMLIKFLKS